MQAYCFAQASLVACMLQVQWSARGAHAPHTASCISWWASGSTRKLFHSPFFVFLLHSCSPFPLKVSLAKVSSPKDTVEYCSLLTRKTCCFDPVCGERYFVSHFYHTPSPCWCESQESNRSRLLLNCQDRSWSCPGAGWIATVHSCLPSFIPCYCMCVLHNTAQQHQSSGAHPAPDLGHHLAANCDGSGTH